MAHFSLLVLFQALIMGSNAACNTFWVYEVDGVTYNTNVTDMVNVEAQGRFQLLNCGREVG